MIGFAEI